MLLEMIQTRVERLEIEIKGQLRQFYTLKSAIQGQGGNTTEHVSSRKPFVAPEEVAAVSCIVGNVSAVY